MTENTIFYPERLIGLIKEKGNIISMKKGEYIYHPGDPTDYIYTVKSGQVFYQQNAVRRHRAGNEPAR